MSFVKFDNLMLLFPLWLFKRFLRFLQPVKLKDGNATS